MRSPAPATGDIKRIALITLCLCGICIPPLHAGKLDIDIYASLKIATDDSPNNRHFSSERWMPGDPRHLREEGPWVRHLSHAGYAGLGIAGVVGSIATGGVALAVGFGLVSLVSLWREWRFVRHRSG